MMGDASTIAELLIGIGLDADSAHQEAKRITGDLKKVSQAGDKADKSVDKAGKSVDRFGKFADGAGRFANRLAVAITAMAGGLTLAGKQVLDVGGNFESLRARLKTVTGSVQAADDAFALIKNFASSTPFQVSEITDAFARLKGAGIDPTTESLRQIGDMASANQKSINDWVEAIKDASTGEFERLKEFLIRARKDGDKVAFTFKGVTTEVDATDKAIQRYLIGLGDLEGVAGGMADQMKTLGGVQSNLTDTWEAFLDEVAQMGPLDEMKGLLKDLMEQLGGSRGLAQLLSRTLTDAIRALRRIVQYDLIGILEHAIEVIRFLFENFDALIGLFAAAKTLSAFNAVAQGFTSIGVASAGALGPIGAVAAALLALVPIAMKAGEAIGKALAKDTPERQRAKHRGFSAGTEEISELDPDLARNIDKARSNINRMEAKFGDDPSPSERAYLTKLRANYDSLVEQAHQTINAEKAEQEDLDRQNRQALAEIEAIENMAGAGAAFSTKKDKKKKKKKKKEKFTPTSVAELLQGAARGDLKNIADRTPEAKDIKPTVAVTINNNNFNFKDTFHIKGNADPVKTGEKVVEMIKMEFDRRLSRSGQQLQTNKVR